MDKYYIYLFISCITIAIPGPGVIFTLTNALKYRLISTLPGIIGLAIGMFILSIISATGVGMIIKTSMLIYSIIKVLGAIYLIYIGVKLFKSSSIKELDETNLNNTIEIPSVSLRFRQGFYMSLTNPKPILFFIAIFPQFVQSNQSFILQFLILSLTFCGLVFIIHFIYATFIDVVKKKLINDKNRLQIVYRIGGSFFMLFAFILLLSIIKVIV